MDPMEEQVIEDNIGHLCKETKGLVEIMSTLSSLGLTSLKDLDSINNESTPYHQKSRIYDALKNIGWTETIELLEESGNGNVAFYLNTKLDQFKLKLGQEEEETFQSVVNHQTNLYRNDMAPVLQSTDNLLEIGMTHNTIRGKHEKAFREALSRKKRSSRLSLRTSMDDLSSQIDGSQLDMSDLKLGRFRDAISLAFGEMMQRKCQELSGTLKKSVVALALVTEDGPGSSTSDWREDKDYEERKEYFLENYGEDEDVVFLVGSNGEPLHASKMALIIASPQFEKFFKIINDDLEGTMEEVEDFYIKLPEIPSNIFQAFNKLLPPRSAEDYIDTVRHLKLSILDTLHVIAFAREYGVTELADTLNNAVDHLFSERSAFLETRDFLELPQNILLQLLKSNSIQLNEYDLFGYVWTWAVHNCTAKYPNTSQENIRKTLGDCLYQIRFPIMTLDEFSVLSSTKPVLHGREETSLLEYISTKDKTKKSRIKVPFPTIPRTVTGGFFTQEVNFSNPVDVLFDCDGTPHKTHILNYGKEINLHGLGFHGPMTADSLYTVKVEIFDHDNRNKVYRKVTKNVFARKKEIFSIRFHEPISLRVHDSDSRSNAYTIEFSIKGAPTESNEVMTGWPSFESRGGKILKVNWVNHRQLASIYVTNQ